MTRLRPASFNALADRIELWIARTVFGVGPNWPGPPDWTSWIAHRLFVAVPTLLTWWPVGPWWAVGVAWAGTLIYGHDEAANRNWSWSDHDEKPWIWDGLLDVPLDVALATTALAFLRP